LYNPTISSSDSPLYPCSLDPPLQQHQGTANTFVTFTVPYAQLWSPSNPYLYHFEVELGQDTVQSYLGFRTIEKKMDNRGILRPFLNGQFVFQLGTLDQGFWPDGERAFHFTGFESVTDVFFYGIGLYTAPTFEAMTSDLKVLKLLGFNMLRKHIKIEPDLFYHACDQIGLMVWQVS
jgi:beta-galactosidase/beta-glucuronidase